LAYGIFSIATLLASAFSGLVAQGPADSTAKDRAALQGTGRLVELEADGQMAPHKKDATLYFRSYSPGLITSIVLYLPLFAWISCDLIDMSPIAWLVATCISAGVHFVEVRHNVFRSQTTTPAK
jgi:hypothetical protein